MFNFFSNNYFLLQGIFMVCVVVIHIKYKIIPIFLWFFFILNKIYLSFSLFGLDSDTHKIKKKNLQTILIFLCSIFLKNNTSLYFYLCLISDIYIEHKILLIILIFFLLNTTWLWFSHLVVNLWERQNTKLF